MKFLELKRMMGLYCFMKCRSDTELVHVYRGKSNFKLMFHAVREHNGKPNFLYQGMVVVDWYRHQKEFVLWAPHTNSIRTQSGKEVEFICKMMASFGGKNFSLAYDFFTDYRNKRASQQKRKIPD